ncbi:MAG: LacI family DNA-binding transcriptional regulator [Kiritimatiellae bacterium]|nr:LacI family DNA-binding transcriptional regulator [Kiritimatiellia bacterium]
MKRPTIRSIASELNLSTATVSMALRGEGRMAKDTRMRVIAHARKCGYVADPLVAAGLSRARRGDVFHENLACLWDVDPLHQPWSKSFRTPRDQRSADLGYKVEDRVVDFDDPRKLSAEFRVLRARGVRGIILAPLKRPRMDVKLDLEHFAWVGIGYSVPEPGIRRVIRDLRRDIPRCVRALVARGCRRIGFANDAERAVMSRDAMLAHALAWHYRADRPLANPYFDMVEGKEGDFRTWLAHSKLDGLVWGHAVKPSFLDCVPDDLPTSYLSLPYVPHRDPGCIPNFGRIGFAAIDLLRNMLTHNELGLPDHAESIAIESLWFEAGQRMEVGE